MRGGGNAPAEAAGQRPQRAAKPPPGTWAEQVRAEQQGGTKD